MRTILAIALVLGLGIAAPAQGPGKAPTSSGIAWIELPATAKVVGLRIQLGDVAKIDALDDALKKRIARLEIGRIARASDVIVLTRETVQRLLGEAGIKGPGLSISGAASVEARPDTQPIPAEDQESLARRFVEKALAGAAGVLSVATPQPFVAFEVPKPRYRLETSIVADEKNPAYAGLVNLLLVVTIDGEVFGRFPAPMYVRREAEVVVAKRRVPPGSKVGFDDLALEKREITRLGGDVALDIEQVAGLVVTGGLAPGQAVLRRDLKQTPVVRRGAMVTVRVVTGSLAIEAVCRALEEGAPGERILFENVESKKTFHAVVIDSRTAAAR